MVIRSDANGNAALEAELLEGFQLLIGWGGSETMATYIKTLAKRKALEAIQADEDEQEQSSCGLKASNSQRGIDEPHRIKNFSEHTNTQDPSLHLDKDEFEWYEDEV